MQLYLPLTWDLFRSKVQDLPQLAKRLRGWVRALNLVGNFHGQWTVQESRRRNRNPSNNASHLRWWPEEFEAI
jgi:hypothetical protein